MTSSLPDDDSLDRRLRLRFSADEIRATLNRKPVRIVDISLTGLGFETTQRLDLQGTHEFYLDTADTGSSPLRLSGRVVWCRGAGIVDTEERLVTPLYRAGLRFGPLGIEDARRLHALLKNKAMELGAEYEETTSEFRREDIDHQREQPVTPTPETTRTFSREEIARAVRDAME